MIGSDKKERSACMFATFKINLHKLSGDNWNQYYEIGINVYEEYKREIKASLNKYLSVDGELKASEIEKDWFPSFKADVFLSHSHKDEKDAIALAGFLKNAGLTVFIDSCVWGYANDLLRQIDNKYCGSKINSDGSIKTYDYEKRNKSTAHIHMILNGALMKMMDSTECLIFLDTPNSLKTRDVCSVTTNSEWIYSELLMSKYLRKNCPSRKNMEFVLNEYDEHNALSVEYDADITHLTIITMEDIICAKKQSKHIGLDVLDQLYLMKKIYKGE